MSVAIIIPARLASVRLPNKPLLKQTGRFLIQHVVDQAKQSRYGHRVIVAVDDVSVLNAVQSFGGTAVMTSVEHVSGTDRIAEVAQQLDADIIVNLQGDEPRCEPAVVDELVQLLIDDPAAGMASLMTPIRDVAMYTNPNAVKVITDDRGRALCFSRASIPHGRDGLPDFNATKPLVHLHLGVYVYRRDVLLKLAKTPPHPWEQLEKLEQLRYLATGGTIRMATTPVAHRGVDTPEDYDDFVRYWNATHAE